jgi:hypothetical protein
VLLGKTESQKVGQQIFKIINIWMANNPFHLEVERTLAQVGP